MYRVLSSLGTIATVISVLDQNQIHQKPRHTSVPIIKRMNPNKAVVKRGRDDNRMLALPPLSFLYQSTRSLIAGFTCSGGK